MVVELQDPPPGTILDSKFKVGALLGQGGFGSVYTGEQLNVRRQVAIKIMHPASVVQTANMATLQERFVREARTTACLHHPNTVQLIDFGQTVTGRPYLVLELLQGGTVEQELKRNGPFPTARAARIGQQICHSLAEAHELGIVHRDLKPANIFLCSVHGQQDFVKVMDFGVAKLLEPGPGEENLTSSGQAIGTPLYMSPEQVMGQELTPATDFFALGAMLYEMVSGKRPFTGPNAAAVAFQRVIQPAPPVEIPGAAPDVERQWGRLLAKLMERTQTDRPASAAEVAAALAPLMVHADEPQRGERRSVPAPPPDVTHLRPTSLTVAGQAATPLLAEEFPGAPGPVSTATAGLGRTPPAGPQPGPSRLAVALAAALVGFVLVLGAAGFVAYQWFGIGNTNPAAPAGPGPVAGPSTLPLEPKTDGAHAGPAPVDVPSTAPAPTPTPVPTPTPDPAGNGSATAAAPAPEPTAHLVLDSTPTGATVLRAGEPICTTPCDVDLKPGEGPETLQVQRAGRRTTSVEVDLTAGANIQRQIKLRREKKAEPRPEPPKPQPAPAPEPAAAPPWQPPVFPSE